LGAVIVSSGVPSETRIFTSAPTVRWRITREPKADHGRYSFTAISSRAMSTMLLERRRMLSQHAIEDRCPHVFVNLYSEDRWLGRASSYSSVKRLMERCSKRIGYDISVGGCAPITNARPSAKCWRSSVLCIRPALLGCGVVATSAPPDRSYCTARIVPLGTVTPHLGRLADLRHGGVAHDKAWFEQHVEPFSAILVESFDDGSDRFFGLLARLLADGGQVDMGQLGQDAVIVAGHRDTARNVDTRAAQLVEQPDRHAVIGGTYRGRTSSSAH
jgi:hypothetical protein